MNASRQTKEKHIARLRATEGVAWLCPADPRQLEIRFEHVLFRHHRLTGLGACVSSCTFERAGGRGDVETC